MSADADALDAEPSRDASPESIATGFDRWLASETLRTRTRWAGAVLAFTALLMPAELAWGRPLFLWEILRELPPVGLLAALSPALAGLIILVLSYALRQAASLASAILVVLLVNAAVVRLGASATAWDVLALPESLTTGIAAALMAEAFAGAAITLAYRRDTRVAGRLVLGLSCLTAVWFYCVPAQGELPITTIARVFLTLPLLPDLRYVLGHSLIAFIALVPLGAVVVAAATTIRPPRTEPRVLAPAVTFALPGVLFALTFRSVVSNQGDTSIVSSLCAALVMAALLALIASATVVLADTATALRRRSGGGPAASARAALVRTTAAAAALGLLCAGVIAWLARPAPKGVEYPISYATPAAARVLGHELPTWDAVRAGWAERRRDNQASTASAVELQKSSRALMESGRALDPATARALEALVRNSTRLDLAGRRWFRLVEDLNATLRGAGHPFYVDPRVTLLQTEGGLETRFHLATYRVEAVRLAAHRKRPFAVLRVRQLGGPTDKEGRLLGLSRDAQPFALVDLGVVEEEATDLDGVRRGECADAREKTVLFEACQLLATLGDAAALREALLLSTEHHELEHQIDGPHLVLASPVLRRLPGVLKSHQDRVNRELSAYLAEMTGPGAAPRVALLEIALMMHRSPSSTLYQVGVLALEALVDGSLAGPIERVGEYRAARTVAELRSLDDATLRARAATAWRRVFRGPTPEIELFAVTQAPGAPAEPAGAQ